MKAAFLDTSIILRILLRERDPFNQFDQFERWYASRLLIIEARRVLQSMFLNRELDEEKYGSIQIELSSFILALSIISLRERVLQRAEDAFPLPVATLDALHVSSALLLAEALTNDSVAFLTHDTQQAKVANACGVAVEGV